MAIESHVHDGSAWRKVKQMHVHDGTAWRKAKKTYCHDGTAWRLVFSGGSWLPMNLGNAGLPNGSTIEDGVIFGGEFYILAYLTSDSYRHVLKWNGSGYITVGNAIGGTSEQKLFIHAGELLVVSTYGFRKVINGVWTNVFSGLPGNIATYNILKTTFSDGTSIWCASTTAQAGIVYKWNGSTWSTINMSGIIYISSICALENVMYFAAQSSGYGIFSWNGLTTNKLVNADYNVDCTADSTYIYGWWGFGPIGTGQIRYLSAGSFVGIPNEYDYSTPGAHQIAGGRLVRCWHNSVLNNRRSILASGPSISQLDDSYFHIFNRYSYDGSTLCGWDGDFSVWTSDLP